MMVRPSNIIELHDDFIIAEVENDVICVANEDIMWYIADETDEKALVFWGIK